MCLQRVAVFLPDTRKREVWMPGPSRPLDDAEAAKFDEKTVVWVPCRRCVQCAFSRCAELVGMAIAESQGCDQVLFATLTWDDLHLRGRRAWRDRHAAGGDLYKDFQKFMKRLRWHLKCNREKGVSVRYFVVGEYGGRRKRPHFHVILFFTGCKMQVVDVEDEIDGKRDPWSICFPRWWLSRDDDAMIHWAPWVHGKVFIRETTSPAAYWYMVKYSLKGERRAAVVEREEHRVRGLVMQEADPCVRWSLKPTLGGAWFQDLAERRAREGLPPRDFSYGWLDVCDRDGKMFRFKVRNTARRNFVRQYVAIRQAMELDYQIPLRRKPYEPEIKKALQQTVAEVREEERRRRGPPVFDREEWVAMLDKRSRDGFVEWKRERERSFDEGRPKFREHGLGWIAKEYGRMGGVPCVVGVWPDGRRSVWTGAEGRCVQWFAADELALFERYFVPVFDRVEREKIEAEVTAVADGSLSVWAADADEFRSWADGG